ncbi:MAG: twin-arginine translocase subunit TatC [Gammaproteobacteria bacterium]|nr:twin-arginine translocase subunit TatC [Gammaproteobacteria bacterium]
MSHLIEMRDRVMRMMLAILLLFVSMFYWANDIYTYLAQPLIKHLPEGSSMIAIDVASPFLTPFKLVLMLSIFLAMPVILYQFWAFVAPGLYKHEKRLAVPLLISSVLLFYSGIAFAYYVVFPLVFGFFTSIGPEAVSIATDIGRYLDFVISIFFGFGLAFEIPVATIIVIALGMTTPEKLGEKRPYVVVGAFVIGMLLTPPDVISQVLLAIPMWLLFESGLIAARYLLADKIKETKERELEEKAMAASSSYDDDYEIVNDPADQQQMESLDNDGEEYEPLTDEEMEAELNKMDEALEYDDYAEEDDGDYDEEGDYDDEAESQENDESLADEGALEKDDALVENQSLEKDGALSDGESLKNEEQLEDNQEPKKSE